MGVVSVWHVGFTVSNLERSIPFYRDGLGLKVRHSQVQENLYTSNLVGYGDVRLSMAQFELENGASPTSGHVLELTQYERPLGEPVGPGTNRPGIGHLAVEVDDIDQVCDRLVQLGGTPLSPIQEITEGINRGGRAVYVRDLDGIAIELVQAPPHPGQPSVERLEPERTPAR